MLKLKEYLNGYSKLMDFVELDKCLKKVSQEYKIKHVNPELKDIFKAFNLCPYNTLKVVMLGLDPYPQKDVATGLLFGNKKDTKVLSPSLEIIKEAAIDYEINHNMIEFDNSLIEWAKQGVLLLNSALTVEVNKTGSHLDIWRVFMTKFLFNLSNSDMNIIYVLFGKQAQSFEPVINSKTNIIFKDYHPSYYVRIGKKMSSHIFHEISKLTEGLYGTPIQWYKEI